MGAPLAVNHSEDRVLRAFVGCPALDTEGLKDKCRGLDAVYVIRQLRKKYDGQFAPAIRLAGGKGKGGYLAFVVDVVRLSG